MQLDIEHQKRADIEIQHNNYYYTLFYNYLPKHTKNAVEQKSSRNTKSVLHIKVRFCCHKDCKVAKGGSNTACGSTNTI